MLTLVDIKNHIFSHLMTESTFSLNDDIASIKLPKDEMTETVAQYKVGLFKTALTDLVRIGVVAEVEGAGGVYVLTQPLNSYTQTVTLAPMTAEMVGDLVNSFSDVIDGGDEDGGSSYRASKMNITGEDIARLCHMILDEGPPGSP